MQQFNFDGEWKFEMNLMEFSQSNSNWDQKLSSYERTKDGLIKIKIIDFRDFEPDPKKEQIETLKYIQQNGKLILDSLFDQLNIINKVRGDSFGEHDWYQDINELGKLFLIREIEIFTEHKDGQAYFQLNGEYKGDLEHGLIVAMHKDRLIGFDAIGEDTYKEVYDDLGEEGDKVKEYYKQHRYPRKEEVHTPLPKYEKFKPWQLHDTSDYFDKLLREKNNTQLIQELESNSWNLNLRFPNLGKNILDKAGYANNVEIMKYLLSKNTDSSKTLEQCLYKGGFHYEAVKCLVENGISINTISAWGLTPLCHEIKNYIMHIRTAKHYKEGDRGYERAIGEIEKSKEKISFLISLGANPSKMDNEGNDYKSFLVKKFKEDFLVENHIVANLKKLVLPENSMNANNDEIIVTDNNKTIVPDKPKKSKWKFWKKN